VLLSEKMNDERLRLARDVSKSANPLLKGVSLAECVSPGFAYGDWERTRQYKLRREAQTTVANNAKRLDPKRDPQELIAQAAAKAYYLNALLDDNGLRETPLQEHRLMAMLKEGNYTRLAHELYVREYPLDEATVAHSKTIYCRSAHESVDASYVPESHVTNLLNVLFALRIKLDRGQDDKKNWCFGEGVRPDNAKNRLTHLLGVFTTANAGDLAIINAAFASPQQRSAEDPRSKLLARLPKFGSAKLLATGGAIGRQASAAATTAGDALSTITAKILAQEHIEDGLQRIYLAQLNQLDSPNRS
jgi:hypothetical protein